jgi:hypothetical protein
VVRRRAAAGSRPKPTVCRDRKAAVLEAIRRVYRTPPGAESGAGLHRGDAGTWESPGAPWGHRRRRRAAQRGKDSRRGKAAPALHTSLGSPRDTKPEARPQGIGEGEGAPHAPEGGPGQSERSRGPLQVGNRRPTGPPGGKATPGRTTAGGPSGRAAGLPHRLQATPENGAPGPPRSSAGGQPRVAADRPELASRRLSAAPPAECSRGSPGAGHAGR